MYYARESEIQTSIPQTALLDELSLVYTTRFRTFSKFMTSINPRSPDSSLAEMRRSFLGFAVQRDLRLYIDARLSPGFDSFIAAETLESLAFMSIKGSITSKYNTMPNLDLALLILQKRPGSNRKSINKRSWNIIIDCIHKGWEEAKVGDRMTQLDFILMLLNSGEYLDESNLNWVEFIFVPQYWSLDLYFIGFTQTICKVIGKCIENGADPNMLHIRRMLAPKLRYLTLWGHLLDTLCKVRQAGSEHIIRREFTFQLVKTFLEYGADRNYVLWEISGDDEEMYRDTNGCTANEILTRLFSQEQVEALAFACHDQGKSNEQASSGMSLLSWLPSWWRSRRAKSRIEDAAEGAPGDSLNST